MTSEVPLPTEAMVLAAAKSIFLDKLATPENWRAYLPQMSTARAALLAARLEVMYPST